MIKDVNIVDKVYNSYSIDGGFQLNKNRKYCPTVGFFSVYDINY